MLVDELLGWLKAYLATPEFKEAYAKVREDAQPTAPEDRGTVDEEIQRRHEDQQAQIAEMRKNLENAPADQRKQMQEAVESTARQMEAMDKDPKMQSIIRTGIENERAQEKSRYEDALAAWQDQLPEDPGRLVAKHVHEFLEACADVDFEAKLVPNGARMKFADPKYEAKDSNWKLCFRAGKEAVAAAREFGTAWLAELPK